MAQNVSKIVTNVWTEPEAGQSAEVWSLTESEWETVDQAIDWVEEYWTKHGEGDEIGNTIVETSMHHTAAKGNEDHCDNLENCLERLAENVRYSSGEGLYSEDCPAFKKIGIERS